MPLDFKDQLQVDKFRKNTIAKGVPENQVDAFITEKSGSQITVGKGDTLTGISQRTGVPVATLASTNRLADPDKIQAGQTLNVPLGPRREGVQPRLQPETEISNLPRQKSILGKKVAVTQRFGNRSSVEKFSGGINYGVDFAAPRGTKVAVPQGRWKVLQAFDGATIEGPNNRQGGINNGYGNSVFVQNLDTGEKLRFSHLRVGGVNVRPNTTIKGGTIVGEVGASGNTAGRTGVHLDLEAYDSRGRPMDVLRSRYANQLF